jgi:hypothetical protein
MLKVYIAGPMTGLPEFNHPAFNTATALWRKAGWDVINPVELDDTTHKPHHVYLRKDIQELMRCDAIAILPNWESSPGASAEVAAAKACNIPLFNANHPGTYVTHPFRGEHNECCLTPKYNHEDHWNDYS